MKWVLTLGQIILVLCLSYFTQADDLDFHYSRLVYPETVCTEPLDCPRFYRLGAVCQSNVYCGVLGDECEDNDDCDGYLDECMKSTKTCVPQLGAGLEKCEDWNGCKFCPESANPSGVMTFGQCRVSVDKMMDEARRHDPEYQLRYCKRAADCESRERCLVVTCLGEPQDECHRNECEEGQICTPFGINLDRYCVPKALDSGPRRGFKSNLDHNCDVRAGCSCDPDRVIGVCYPNAGHL